MASDSEDVSNEEGTENGTNSLLVELEADRKKTRKSPIDRYTKAAKWITRSEKCFVDYHDVLSHGLSWAAGRFGQQTREQFKASNSASLDAWDLLHKYVHCFEEDLLRIQSKPERLDDLARVLNTASRKARGEDISSLNDKGFKYLKLEFGPVLTEDGQNLRLSEGKKSETRGLAHNVTGQLICPIRLLDEFHQNQPRFAAAVENAQIKITGKMLPFLLYDRKAFTSGHPEVGLFRGELLLRTWKHIFTSPMSAVDLKLKAGQTKTKQGQALKNGMKKVTPQSIAYAAMQLRFWLSAVDDWRIPDGFFVYRDFYEFIETLLGPDSPFGDEWVKDTLAWWDGMAFSAHWLGTSHEEDEDDGLDDLSLLKLYVSGQDWPTSDPAEPSPPGSRSSSPGLEYATPPHAAKPRESTDARSSHQSHGTTSARARPALTPVTNRTRDCSPPANAVGWGALSGLDETLTRQPEKRLHANADRDCSLSPLSTASSRRTRRSGPIIESPPESPLPRHSIPPRMVRKRSATAAQLDRPPSKSPVPEQEPFVLKIPAKRTKTTKSSNAPKEAKARAVTATSGPKRTTRSVGSSAATTTQKAPAKETTTAAKNNTKKARK